MARTAGQILARVRNHIEEPVAGYWSDTELYAIIGNKQLDLWRRVVSLRDTYFVSNTPATLSLVSGTSKYNLPADFYSVKSLRSTTSGQENITFRWTRMSDPEFLNGLRTDIVVANPSDVLYAILGGSTQQIQFSPVPQSSLTVSMEYIIQPLEITGAADVFAFPDAFLNFIEYAATAEALAKGPVGDPAYWDTKSEREWITILQDVGCPRSDGSGDFVEGMFSRY